MLATEHGALTNSLWRELLDYLPVPALLFRIGDNDHARLMFANREIENVLGYTPGEYVLESESEGRVQKELNRLVDRIAELSHSDAKNGAQHCELTSKVGALVAFGFSYRIFRSKSANNHFIVVTLDAAGKAGNRQRGAGGSADIKSLDDEFIDGSEVMQGAMNKAWFIATQPVHGWIMGEQGTGRTTVALRISRMIEARAGDITVFHCKGGNRPDTSEWKVAPGSRIAIIILDNADSLRSSDFDVIKNCIDGWTAGGISVKVLVTAPETPERMHATGHLPESWIYGMTFNTVLLPPLRQRGPDIREIASSFTKKAAALLGIREPVWDTAAEEQLRRHTWPGNITELKTRTGRALLTAKSRAVRLVLNDEIKEDKTSRPESAGQEPFEIIPFDEMSAKYLRQVLNHTGGKIYGKDGAAALLKLKPTTLQSKLIRLGVKYTDAVVRE